MEENEQDLLQWLEDNNIEERRRKALLAAREELDLLKRSKAILERTLGQPCNVGDIAIAEAQANYDFCKEQCQTGLTEKQKAKAKAGTLIRLLPGRPEQMLVSSEQVSGEEKAENPDVTTKAGMLSYLNQLERRAQEREQDDMGIFSQLEKDMIAEQLEGAELRKDG